MAKQLNVSLNFTANTAQAKAQMQELQRQLNNLTGSLTSTDLPITREIREAISETAKLEVALKQSMNMDTGKFDLSKFNDTLKKSGTSLQQLAAKLNAVGPEGKRAFMSLAQSIAAAEIPMRRTNTLLNSMWTTMKNTARWQLSSSALHAFTGALHSAVGYAKDLNESLNNIRIVTSDSVEDMAKFAEQANKAAKTLGTTTTRYTNAALIYYQQGLSDSEVQERTNATVKMANVTGENAQDVSSYMTAIWNNFDDGSKSLEYFADVITKLGAETAASSKEIAGGLEKFAAIGETVGLSYEYATAALTTIIDKTRQSEDVVGTALKTIFARIQGLKMGEETEDGLDLNKYSAALAQYGIDIFDANRNLKDMDVILDEMGAKWETLNRAQKVGLAQTVAGVRQYNQLVSLMDNWDAMEQNVQRAESSSGSLDKQAEIYEESWEAASNRVRAALESIYSDLLDDDFLIDIMNGLEKIISFTDQLIDSAGGLKGVLAGISAIVFKLFSSQISTGIQNMVYSLTPMKVKQQQAEDIKQRSYAEVKRYESTDVLSASDSAEMSVLRNRLQLEELINRKKSDLNIYQQQEIEQLQKINSLAGEKHILAQKNAEEAQSELIAYENARKIRGQVVLNNNGSREDRKKFFENYAKTYDKNYLGAEVGRQELKTDLFRRLTDTAGAYRLTTAEAEKYINIITKQIDAEQKAIQSGENLDNVFDRIFADIDRMQVQPPDYSTIFVNAAQAASSLAFSINAISQAFETWKDPDMEWGEKLSSISMSLLMALPGLITGLQGLSTARTDLIAKMLVSLGITEADTIATILNGEASIQSAISEGIETGAIEANNIAKTKNIALTKILNIVTKIGIGHLLLLAAAIFAVVKIIDHFTISQKELSEQFDTYEEAADKVKSLKDELDGVNDSIDELLSKGLSQLTDEEQEQLKTLREQKIELQNQLALAEKIAEEENKKFAKDFETRSNQNGFSGKEGAFFRTNTDEIKSKENGFSDISLTSLKSYQTAEIAQYAADLERAFNNKEISETNYNFLKEKIEAIEKDNADRNEEISEDYELAKGYLSSDYAKEDTQAYEDAIAAVERYYSYLGDAVNYKQDIVDLYGVSEEDLQNAQGRYEDVTELMGSSFYDKLQLMAEETGLSVEFLADKLGLFKDSVNKLSQEDVFTNFIELVKGKTSTDNKNLENTLQGKAFSSGTWDEDYTSVDLQGKTLGDVFRESGLSVQEQQDILLNIDWANQTQAESVLQALQQIEELQSDDGMVQEAISLGYSEEQFEAMAAGIMRTNEAFADNEKLAKQAAIYQMRLSKAIDAGSEVWDDYGDALKEADENNSDYYEGLGALADVFTENLNFEVDWSDIEENLDLVEKAMEGDADAAAELAQQLAFDSIDTKLNEVVETDLANLKDSLTSMGDDLPDQLSGLMNKSLDEIKTGWADAKAYLDDNDLEIGAYVDDKQVYESLNNMIAASGMTAEEAQDYLSSIGYEGELETTEVTMPGTTTSGVVTIGDFLDIPYSFTKNAETISVPYIKDGSLQKTAPKTGLKNVSSGSQSKSSKGGGSKKDMERYHTVSKQMESLDKQYDTIGTKKDSAFGANKLAYMDQEIAKLDEVIAKNDEYIAQIEKNLASDKAKMDAYGAEYDADGNITNYRTLFKQFGQDEDFQEALSNYEDSVERFADATQDKLNKELEKMSLNYEKFTYKINLKVELNEMEMEWMNYEYDKISDDVYKAAEAMGVLGNKVKLTEQALTLNGEAKAELDELYKNGDITQEDYIAGLKDQYSSTMDNLQALQEYDAMMKEYYGNTLEMAKEELAEYMEQFDQMNSVLDHYQNILELIGKEQDYDKMGAILEGQAKIANDRLASATDWYNTQKELQAELEAEYAKNQSESVKNALEAQKEATAEAYEDMLVAGEEAAEIAATIFENEMKKTQEILENALSGGLGFDRLKESMQHVSDIQDEYLTKTNQVYEANKLLNNISNDINKTNNTTAKQRLNSFAQEIEQLKQKDKLSNLELEIAQAKYKQLQAQIALEEAQNAKSTVRLSRDNEGNYGYIYTSDQEAVSGAEQELADAENDLYNIRLNATNDYGQKVIQLNEELAQKLAEIDNNMNLTYEEKEAQKAEIMQQYYEKMGVYTDLYGIAQMEDARVVEDAWVNTYDDIITAGEEHKIAIENYNTASTISFQKWQESVNKVEGLVGTDLGKIQDNVKKVTDESESLRKKLVDDGGVIDALGETLDEVKDLTIKYGEQEDAIKDLEKEYENLCKDIQKTVTEYSRLETAALEAAAAMEKVSSVPATSGKVSDGKNNNPSGDTKDKEDTKVKEEPDQNINNGDKGSNNEKTYRVMATLVVDPVIGKKATYSADGSGASPEEAKAAAREAVRNKAYGTGKYAYGTIDKGTLSYGQISTFDTGGYTGKWGPEGKLAMLHEKEIVLNKEDSANILKVVEIVRAMIDANAANAGIGALYSPGINTQNQNLEQTVTITAEFPNATDHNEIEMAFNSLINRASQYANRK